MADNQPEAPPTIQPPPPTTPSAAGSPSPSSGGSARTWDMFCHLSALAMLIGIPFGNIIGPLVVWLIKKDEFPSVNVHGKQSLNFQITISIAAVATIVAGFISTFFCCIGPALFIVAVLIGLAGVILPIIAGVKANNGEPYQYPYSIEFVK